MSYLGLIKHRFHFQIHTAPFCHLELNAVDKSTTSSSSAEKHAQFRAKHDSTTGYVMLQQSVLAKVILKVIFNA